MNNGTFGCVHNCGDVCKGHCLKTTVSIYTDPKERRDELYNDIEDRIIRWNNDGAQTAGFLTREIMALLEKRGVIFDIKD
jgi:hypothetical protein